MLNIHRNPTNLCKSLLLSPLDPQLKSVVRFGDLPPVYWSISQPGHLISGMVEIWRFNLDSYLDHIQELYELLDYEEKAKSAKFYNEGDRNMFIASKALTRTLLSGYLNIVPRKISFSRSKHKKPYIQNSAIHFNVSHSGQYILIAVSDDEVGIDVEYYKQMTLLKEELDKIFSGSEISAITDYNPIEKASFKLWTRKEALLKGTSQGIPDNLKDIPCLNGTHLVNQGLLNSRANWSIYSFEVDDDYVASVAFIGNDKKIIFNKSLIK